MRSLTDLFEERRLVRPTPDAANLVELVRALGSLGGAEMELSLAARELAELIGPAEHIIFVLLDGLGMNIVRRLPRESFIARTLKKEIQATCPSTTACALTSVATGEYPATHGVTGWFTYLPEFEITAIMLPFAERFTKESLTARGIDAEKVLPVPAFYSRMKHRPLTLLPKPIFDTPYARYSRGYTEGAGYDSLPHAVNQIVGRIREASGPTYTHLYLPDVDTLCHHNGVNHADVIALVMKIDGELERLAGALSRKRLVISADHGLIDVPPGDQTLLMPGDAMLELLVVPPVGDARMPIFHVRKGQRDAFVEMFRHRFGDGFVLISREEAEALRLFGPERMSDEARRRFGDFVAIPFLPVTLAYSPATATPTNPYIGQHAGLSPQEMWVPLCIA